MLGRGEKYKFHHRLDCRGDFRETQLSSFGYQCRLGHMSAPSLGLARRGFWQLRTVVGLSTAISDATYDTFAISHSVPVEGHPYGLFVVVRWVHSTTSCTRRTSGRPLGFHSPWVRRI